MEVYGPGCHPQNIWTGSLTKTNRENTLTGQKYFRTKIFPYIFHIKLLIFITFS
jgi:hypothetical protein